MLRVTFYVALVKYLGQVINISSVSLFSSKTVSVRQLVEVDGALVTILYSNVKLNVISIAEFGTS